MGQAVGIDFGTTNTVVSYIGKNGDVKSVKYGNSFLIPSVIFFKSKDEYIIGEKAKKLFHITPSAGAENFKSKLDGKETIPITAQNGDSFQLQPRLAVRYFLNMVVREVSDRLEKEFGDITAAKIDRAVITVPAKFNDKQVTAIKKAAQQALNIVSDKNIKCVPEPTAAAVAAQQNETEKLSSILIYDFGGGTFDVSVLKKENFKHSQIETDGEKNLGGNNLTRIIAREILEGINDEYGKEFPLDLQGYDAEYYELSEENYKINLQKIFEAAEQTKIDLSDEPDTDVFVNVYLSDEESVEYARTVTRKDLERWLKKPIERTVEITENVLHRPAVEQLGEIDKIVLAGGSSQIPLIREVLEQKLQRSINFSENVSTLISQGAAILAQEINSVDALTEQVTNFQIGVAATEGMAFHKFQMIIPENVKLPYESSKDFSLARDGQQKLKIAYFEYDVKNYPNAKTISDAGIQEIDTIIVENLPPNLRKDETVVTVNFRANKDGSVDVSAQVKNLQGEKIGGSEVNVKKESDLL